MEQAHIKLFLNKCLFLLIVVWLGLIVFGWQSTPCLPIDHFLIDSSHSYTQKR